MASPTLPPRFRTNQRANTSMCSSHSLAAPHSSQSSFVHTAKTSHCLDMRLPPSQTKNKPLPYPAFRYTAWLRDSLECTPIVLRAERAAPANFMGSPRVHTLPAKGIRKGSVQTTLLRMRAMREELTARVSSMGNSGGMTEVRIMVQLR